MLRLVALAVILMLNGCGGKVVPHSTLLGKWKSNEKLTLESMNGVEGVTKKAREVFENNFFGHLVVEYKEKEYRSINDKDNIESSFVPYEVLEVTDRYIRIREWSDLLKENEESTLYFEGDCYYVITSKFNFREYFCRYG